MVRVDAKDRCRALIQLYKGYASCQSLEMYSRITRTGAQTRENGSSIGSRPTQRLPTLRLVTRTRALGPIEDAVTAKGSSYHQATSTMVTATTVESGTCSPARRSPSR